MHASKQLIGERETARFKRLGKSCRTLGYNSYEYERPFPNDKRYCSRKSFIHVSALMIHALLSH